MSQSTHFIATLKNLDFCGSKEYGKTFNSSALHPVETASAALVSVYIESDSLKKVRKGERLGSVRVYVSDERSSIDARADLRLPPQFDLLWTLSVG